MVVSAQPAVTSPAKKKQKKQNTFIKKADESDSQLVYMQQYVKIEKYLCISFFSNNEPRMIDCLVGAGCSVVSEEVMRYSWQTWQRGLLCKKTKKNSILYNDGRTANSDREVGGRRGSFGGGRVRTLLGDGRTGGPPRGGK